MTEEQARADEGSGGEDRGGAEEPARRKKRKRTSLWEEVEVLGASSFSGQKKRDFDKKQLERLGAKASKNQKMPLTMLRGMRKKQRQREDWERQDMRDMGLTVGKRVKKAKKADLTGGMASLKETGVGKFSKGMLKIRRQDVKHVHVTADRRPKAIHKLLNRR